jgi:flagellar biosynthesis/type III secretory pathway protein FliH
MSDAFRSFASILACREPAGAPEAAALEPAATLPTPAPLAAPLCDERVLDLLDRFVADLARLHARAAERLEEAIDTVVGDVARRVLARELRVEPVALEALLAEALREFDAAAGVVVRVSPHDAERLGLQRNLQVDPGLGPGDFALDVDDGRFDASLQTRLDALLASHRATL